MRRVGIFAVLVAVSLALSETSSIAHPAYKYRDASGQWVYTDQEVPQDVPREPLLTRRENSSLRLVVERRDKPGVTQVIARNDCLCVVTFHATVIRSGFAAVTPGSKYQAIVPSDTESVLLQTARAGDDKPVLQMTVKAALGEPGAAHNPAQPYRVPFDVGSTYRISQAFPSRVTHTTPDSEYAVDIAMPDGTPVYAAREGMVINARHDSFHGAIDPAMLDEANVVEILQGDGTIAIYAHLHWDSIQVRIGERVVRGQLIANSGNTGFTSGPHLHFSVVRNSGSEDVSVPILFEGAAGVGVTPVTHQPLTAY